MSNSIVLQNIVNMLALVLVAKKVETIQIKNTQQQLSVSQFDADGKETWLLSLPVSKAIEFNEGDQVQTLASGQTAELSVLSNGKTVTIKSIALKEPAKKTAAKKATKATSVRTSTGEYRKPANPRLD